MRIHSGSAIQTLWDAGGPFIGPNGKPHGRVTVQDGFGDVLHTTTAAPDLGYPYTSTAVRLLYNRYGFVTDEQITDAVQHPPPTETAQERIDRNVDELNVGLRTWSDLETSISLLPGAVQPDTPGTGTYSQRGLPLRWFQSSANDQVEVEVPNIKTIQIDRSVQQDAATCSITLYNQFMPSTGEGQTGYYTPTRGDSFEGTVRWNFTANSWHHRLVPNAILRTYQGYGGNDKTITQARTDGQLMLTGIWFIDSVVVGTDGMLSIKARDPMKLLIEQQLYPPLVPQAKYPLRYYRWLYSDEALHSSVFTVDGVEYQPIFMGADAATTGEGYYTSDGGNNIDAFGDAREHDFTGGSILDPSSSQTQVRAGRSGSGYYVMNGAGQIAAYGDAGWFGDPFSNGYIAANGLNGVCIDFAITHTGGGYWVLDTFGHTFAFGDATVLGEQAQIFTTGINEYVSIEAHPTQMGYWVLDQAGNVYPWGTGAVNLGSRAITDWTPPLSPGTNDCICLRTTPSGSGYWILTETGQVAVFGDAVFYGENPSPTPSTDWREKFWKLIPQLTERGPGYLLMLGNGEITPLGNAQSYGDAIPGGSSSKRIDGNYRDYVDIVRDLVLWSGFLLFDPSMAVPRGSVPGSAPDPGPSQGGVYTEQNVRDLFLWYGYITDQQIQVATSSPSKESAAERIARITYELNNVIRTWSELNASIAILPSPSILPAVYGNLETTGASSPDPLPDNMFDKRPVIDAIHQIKEVVGYFAWCDDEGGFRFESPNWWAPGNFDEFGNHLEYIPVIDENFQLTNYSVVTDDKSIRSMIIISSEDPDMAVGSTTTVTTRLIPRDRKILRGLVKPAMWVNGWFQSRNEQRIMAELIALHLHFELRQGQVTCPANPRIGIDDQVRIIERNSNEAYIHYVRNISTSMDLDSGVYTMSLQTNWLGTSHGWGVSTTGLRLAEGGFVLSDRCVEWLQSQSKNPIREVLIGN